MNKAELVMEIAKRTGVKQPDIKKVLNGAAGAICDALSKDEDVTWTGFGALKVRTRAARVGRNPKTGESVNIPPRKGITFRPGKKMSESLK